jgi:hypothetical protein
MKAELAREIGPELVYRTKAGFIDPQQALFRDARFIDAVHDALDSGSVLGELLRKKSIQKLLARRDISSLPHGHSNLLWSLAFTDRWYRTASSQPG